MNCWNSRESTTLFEGEKQVLDAKRRPARNERRFHRHGRGGTGAVTSPGLAPRWEWNHNPDNTKWSTGNGLRLQTATVTDDLYAARNTLTHRIQGPASTATVILDHQGMRDGDRAGLALLRDSSAWIGIKRDGTAKRLVVTSDLTMDSNWNTTSTGREVVSTSIHGNRIWLRATADIRPGTGREGHFSYSTDGTNFALLGAAAPLLLSGLKAGKE
ncbi:putative glycosyl hydrolase/xylanase [Streptomyces bingchenggensis BCW-1]|uniref:Putative glycosyl hydrolase/xylanase n=1 Tax=Streptomyces bingchenggensis (strain BCW-1) TaxID=749414 RepID=D7BUB5_STRBB|nr:putative glycosyl hydrolase/xylanase [Streptomyces bingchenggensis BCW-1]